MDSGKESFENEVFHYKDYVGRSFCERDFLNCTFKWK